MVHRSKTYIATPPGATIKEQLNDIGMTQKEFAARMNMTEKHISRLINGEVHLTPEMAVRLELVLGIPAQFWNKLEAVYREKVIKVEMENTMDADSRLVNNLPYNDMVKLGWVAPAKTQAEKIINLRSYFGVVSLHLLEDRKITKIACRRLAVTEKSDFLLMAWAQRARLAAKEIVVSAINIKGLINSLVTIKNMTRKKPEEFTAELKQILADNGIALVFLPHLKGSFLQGATFADGNKIVVGMTARGKDADKFWFSLFHELAHIVLGHIGKINGTTIDDENAADEWAKNSLITPTDLHDFLKNNNISRENIIDFADNEGIAPSIVVGRLQYEKIIKYNMYNELKEKYTIL